MIILGGDSSDEWSKVDQDHGSEDGGRSNDSKAQELVMDEHGRIIMRLQWNS